MNSNSWSSSDACPTYMCVLSSHLFSALLYAPFRDIVHEVNAPARVPMINDEC